MKSIEMTTTSQDSKRYFGMKLRVIVGVFFAVFLLIGLVIFKDYGVHWDEYNNQDYGRRWVKYSAAVVHARSLTGPLPRYIEHDLVHGPVFEIFLVVLTDLCRLKDSRHIIFMRHLIVFLLFYVSVVFFYLLCLRHFQDWRLALLGCVFLMLSPRIFADAFYNSVDIAFLSFFIIGIFTLLRMLDQRSIRSAVIHAFVCALLINVRFIGIFLPVLTVLFFIFEIIRSRCSQNKWGGTIVLLSYISFFLVLAVVFNPFLWSAPWGHLQVMLERSKIFRHKEFVHYFGSSFPHSKLPWHYASVWIMVSTPLLYGVLFFVGIFATLKLFLWKTAESYLTKRNIVIFFICFSLPLIIAKGKLYNGWRHIYFVYPFLLIFVVMGVQYLCRNIRPVIKGVFVIGIIFCLADTASFMIRNHPYQNLYFNRLAGANAGEISHRFSLDYWNVSYREALEYILKTDKDTKIAVCLKNKNGKDYLQILPLEDRKRLVVTTQKEAKYLLAFNRDKSPYSFGVEYYSIMVDGMKIMHVYKMNREAQKE